VDALAKVKFIQNRN